MCNIGDVILIKSGQLSTDGKMNIKKNSNKKYITEYEPEGKPALVVNTKRINGVECYYYLNLIEYKFSTFYDDNRFVRIRKEKAAQLGLTKSYLIDLDTIDKDYTDYIVSGQYCPQNLAVILQKFDNYKEQKSKSKQTNEEVLEVSTPNINSLKAKETTVGDIIWVSGTILMPQHLIDKSHPAIIVSVDFDANEFYYVIATSSPGMEIDEYFSMREELKTIKSKVCSNNYCFNYEELKMLKKITKYYPLFLKKCNNTKLTHDGFIEISNIYKKPIVVYNSNMKKYISNFEKIGSVKSAYLLNIFREIVFFHEMIKRRISMPDEYYPYVKDEIIKMVNDNSENEQDYAKVYENSHSLSH